MNGQLVPPDVSISRQQLALNKALKEKDQVVADMYLGALVVLNHTNNPDRLAQAAHSLRELMEKIPAYVDVETKAHKERLGDKVRVLEDSWATAVQASRCYDGHATWNGEIDKPLRKLLGRLQQFFDWRAEHDRRRRVEIAGTLRRLDGSGRNLPPSLEELEIQHWMKMNEFFQGVAHHGRPRWGQDHLQQGD